MHDLKGCKSKHGEKADNDFFKKSTTWFLEPSLHNFFTSLSLILDVI
jgi:hypothetical protein